MPKQLYVVFETDAWNSTAHRDCKGIYTSKQAAVNAIVKNHDIDEHELFENVHDWLRLTKREREAEAKRRLRAEFETRFQTQGFSVNYDIEVWNQNEWA